MAIKLDKITALFGWKRNSCLFFPQPALNLNIPWLWAYISITHRSCRWEGIKKSLMGYADNDRTHRHLLKSGCTELVKMQIRWVNVVMCYCANGKSTECTGLIEWCKKEISDSSHQNIQFRLDSLPKGFQVILSIFQQNTESNRLSGRMGKKKWKWVGITVIWF